MVSAHDTRRAPTRSAARLVDVALFTGVVGLVAGVVDMFVGVRDFANAPWFAGSAVTLGSATVVRLRRPDHALMLLFAVMAATLGWQYLLQDLLAWAVGPGRPSPWVTTSLLAALRIATVVSVMAAVRLFIGFPGGHRGRAEQRAVRVVDAMVLASFAVLFLTPQIPTPTFIDGEPVTNAFQLPGSTLREGTAQAVIDVANAIAIVGFVFLVLHYRRGDRADRKQMRWLLLPLVGALFGALAELVLWSAGHGGALATLAASSALGVGIGFGLVKPDGIDVDDVLRRSIVWGALWLAIASLYVGLAAAFGATIGQRWSVGWAVTMTVLAMFALQPVRAALERVVNRRLFGAPPDPRRAIARLGDSLADTYDMQTLLPEIATSLEEGLGVEWARIRLTPGTDPDGREPALVVPITLDGDELGVVECGPRLRGELDADDEAIVVTFARQAALAVRNVRLTSQLRDRTTELTASRARLVRAEETERRRIERNIHDGVQQDLVAIIGQTGLIRRQLERDAGPADEQLVSELDALRSGLQRLLSELRELAAGIHPSVLRDQGLLAAVEALAARHPVPVSVRADPRLHGLRLPVEVEGAGYYTVAESLANSLKYAEAGRLGITLATSNGSMSICIDDDGVGFDADRARGNGLANLHERLAAVDGELRVDTEPGRGTTISATLPIDGSAV